MSIHIAAEPGQIAETVLLPGDPLRAKYIAHHFLNHGPIVKYNERRNMLGYTGVAQDGRRVSVQGSGMGMPSLGIYVHELAQDYKVKRIIRVGTCGAYNPSLKLGDIIIAMDAYSDEDLAQSSFLVRHSKRSADLELLAAAEGAAASLGIPVRVGPIHSTDSFYDLDEFDLPPEAPRKWQRWESFGILAVEMESAELYRRAQRYGIQALSILAVSDRLFDFSTQMSAEERVHSSDVTARIALMI